jgi:hypothetical protein
MPSKKRAAAPKAAASMGKSVKTAPAAGAGAATSAPTRHVWTLPVAMLMLILAAGALWLSVHEASNAPQAAAPSASSDVSAPEPAPKADAARPVAAPATATARAAQPTPVSMTGCLQRAGDGFVLKNAEGPAVSKTRSWKSGFLKRSAPSIDLLDTGHAAHLGSHIGQRVAVSGPLADGGLQVQSLRRVAAACQ